RALRGRSAALRYGIAGAGLVGMAIGPIWTTAHELATGHEVTGPRPAVAVAPARSTAPASPREGNVPTARPIGPPVAGPAANIGAVDAIAAPSARITV